jgi:hypothetical protein
MPVVFRAVLAARNTHDAIAAAGLPGEFGPFDPAREQRGVMGD